MTVIRSILFGLLFYGGTVIIGLLLIPLVFLPGWVGQPFFRAWTIYSVGVVRWVAGIRYRVVLKEGAIIPEGPAIYASKHQSAWETLTFNVLLPKPVFVLKKELERIPFFGWYLSKMRQIAVDRKAGAAAMRSMVSQAAAVVADGHSIVIYPQGTRVAPGVAKPYHPGVYALYRSLNIPVVPIALDSGRLWARNGLLKRAGTVTVSILPPIPPGLDRKSFMSQLEQAIETESAILHEANCG